MAPNGRILTLLRLPGKLRKRYGRLARRLQHRKQRPLPHEIRFLKSSRGWQLAVRTWGECTGPTKQPAVLVVPGLHQSGEYFEGWAAPFHLAEVARMGMVAVAVDLSGRGLSWGVEDYGGPLHQDDVLQVLSEMVTWSGVNPDQVGIVSHSLGCAAVAKALCNTPRPDVRWWIDIEGPSDREIITAGGRQMDPAGGHTLQDEPYWRPREASRWVGGTGVGYLRVQRQKDHAQPGEFRHTARMMQAASDGSLPWFRLNEHPTRTVPDRPSWLSMEDAQFNLWLRNAIQNLHSD